MANSLLTPTVIAREGLMQLENNLVLGANVHREYKREFVKVGNSVTVRKPVRFTETDGATRSGQDVTEGSTTITISNRKHVSWQFTTQDLTLTIEEYSQRYVTPAAIVLANGVDSRLAAHYKQFYHSAGTPGTTPNAFSMLGDTATKLDAGAVPDDGMRKLVLNPAARWSLANVFHNVFTPRINEDTLRKGLLGQLAGFQVYGDQNIVAHTAGALVDDSLDVDGASQNQAYSATDDTGTLHVDQFSADTAGALKAGDVFTIADVYAVNPVSKVSTGALQQFTVISDVTPASNEADVTIRPRIITSGAYQTVSTVPADDATITVLGVNSTSYPQNMGFYRNALALVMCPLELPRSSTFKARVDHNGMSIRIVEDYDIDNDEEIIRLDVLEGSKAIYPELGARLWG